MPRSCALVVGIVVVVGGLALTACGGGSGDDGVDITGRWRVAARPTGSPDPFEIQNLTQIAQTNGVDRGYGGRAHWA